MKVAIVGSGIAGLGAVHALQGQVEVTLFEAASYFGGHTHTVDITLPDATGRPVTHGVDTGFLVLNERTYPRLLALFGELGVPLAASDMSFSVQVAGAFGSEALQWSGANLPAVFTQPRNALRPAFWRMLADIVRFNAQATRLAQSRDEASLQLPLGEFLQREKFSPAFCDWYLLPMIGCIWSCPVDQMLRFPLGTLVRFCHNHGLLQITGRPQWWTVAGGARQYVDKVLARVADKRLMTPVRRIYRNASGVLLQTQEGWSHFDKLVLAVHPDQALALLDDATAAEQRVLGSIHYQTNRAVLHTDETLLPTSRRAWAAWNYERAAPAAGLPTNRVCLHYLINKLQPLPWTQPVIVSLNPLRAPRTQQVLGEFDYAHPVLDAQAWKAQGEVPQLQGQRHTYYCGAWTGYGFHEDGLRSGQEAAASLLAAQRPNASLNQSGNSAVQPQAVA